MTNLEHLHVINTICIEGSFQKASEKLHKVRSAVSYSVKQVEESYGVQIFNRETYRPELTSEGKLLIVQIRRLLQHAGEFETYVNELKGENETELRLGVVSIFPIDRISSLLIDLKKEFPSTTIHLEIEVASGERMLMADKVDIGIAVSPGHNPAIEYKLIDSINVPLVISKELVTTKGLSNDSYDDNGKSLTESELASFPQVIVKSSDRLSDDKGVLEDALKWYVTDLASKKALLVAGLGWGRVPLHLVQDEIANGKLVSLDTYPDVDLPIYVTKLKNKALGPVAHKIWNHF